MKNDLGCEPSSVLLVRVQTAKGQLISKAIIGVLDSPKKRTKKI